MTDQITIPRALLERCYTKWMEDADPAECLELVESIRAELAKKINSEAHCAESSVDYWQQRGYLGRPDEWREACRLFRVRCSPEDINSMAKLRAYIEDGLLIVSRPTSKTPTPAQHDAPEVSALKAERDATMKDAERLDYIEESGNFGVTRYRSGPGGPVLIEAEDGKKDISKSASSLRDAIDSVIKEAKDRT